MRFIGKEPDLSFTVDVPPEMLEAMTGGGNIAARISRSEALQVPAVLRSRNLIAGTLARLPIHIRDKKKQLATPTTLLEQIDPNLPNVVTLAQTYEDLLFEGVAWWRITEFGWHGFPTYAEHIGVDRVYISGTTLPLPDSDGRTFGPVRVYVDGRPVPDDLLIRFDSPNPPLLKHAARAIRACLELDKTASDYSANPMPLGAFTPREGIKPREDPKTIEELLTKWESARKRRVWGYVGAAWELKKLQFDAEQIQLAEQRQHAVLEIARAAGVDPEDLGVSTTSRTYQNSEQRRQDLIDFTLAHYMAAVEERLSMHDVIPRGYEAKVNLDGFLRGDTKERMDAYKVAEEVGALTIEEIRDLEDRPQLPKAQIQPPTPPVMVPNGNGSMPQGVPTS